MTDDGRKIRVFSQTIDDLGRRSSGRASGPTPVEPATGDALILGDVSSSYFETPSLLCYESVGWGSVDGMLVSGPEMTGVVEDVSFFQAGWSVRSPPTSLP